MFAGEPIRAADVRAAAARGSDLRTAATAADADANVSTRAAEVVRRAFAEKFGFGRKF